MHAGPVEHLTRDPDAGEPEDDPDPRPKLTPQAQKVIDAMQSKPQLLWEVAGHFDHGWPLEKLVGPWKYSMEGQGILRHLHGDQTTAGAHAVVRPLVGQGHDGSQWEGGVQWRGVEGSFIPRQRIFGTPEEAAVWAEELLKVEGFQLVPMTDKEFDEEVFALRDHWAARSEKNKKAPKLPPEAREAVGNLASAVEDLRKQVAERNKQDQQAQERSEKEKENLEKQVTREKLEKQQVYDAKLSLYAQEMAEEKSHEDILAAMLDDDDDDPDMPF